LNFRRSKHLSWKPSVTREVFEGAVCTSSSDADFHKWFVRYESARQACFQRRCLGNFEVAVRWNDASFVDLSRKLVTIETESTEAETDDCTVSLDPRLQLQANRDKRVFFASPYWTSMLCRRALDQLLVEYNCKLADNTDMRAKAEALRQAAKNRYVQEEFHEQPWRWVRRVQRVLRDARQPWLQMSVVNDRTGLDRAGVPVTKKRIVKMEETDKDCDLFCFLEDAQYLTSNGGIGSKIQKELFVGLKSEVAKRFPEKYRVWVRPEKTQAGAERFCKLCWESEKRRNLARTHNVDFCKFASKEVRCSAQDKSEVSHQ